jgi:hypothetical protein
MPIREDFAIVKARALSDPRLLRAAELYVEKKLAREETALATVIGHVACLGLWTMRETDDGTVTGDGLSTVRAATGTTTRVARVILECLRSEGVDLVTSEGCEVGRVRLRGFVDAYRPVVMDRQRKAKWAQERRASMSTSTSTPADPSTSTDGGRRRLQDNGVDVYVDGMRARAREGAPNARVTGPDRTDSPPPPPDGGAGAPPPSSNGAAHDPANTATEHLRPRDQRRIADERRLEDARQRAIEQQRSEFDAARRTAAPPERQAEHLGSILNQLGIPRTTEPEHTDEHARQIRVAGWLTSKLLDPAPDPRIRNLLDVLARDRDEQWTEEAERLKADLESPA